MRRWILPIVLLLVAAFAAWQAVRTDSAIAEKSEQPVGSTDQALSTPLLSIRRVPQYLRGPTILSNLEDDLDAIASEFPTQSCLVVRAAGEEIYSRNPTLPLVPASAQKILTAYGAYEILGADYAYTTSLVTDAEIVDGVLDGDVWLVGGGDPLVAVASYAGRYDEQPHIFTDLSRVADAVVASGITEITGAVVGDEGRYDTERYVADWPERFTDQNQTGPLSALTVNDGFARFDPVNPANSLAVAAADPARFAAAFFDDLLEARDIVIRQPSRSGPAPPLGRDLVPPLVSEPLESLVDQMLSISDNQAAELLLKEFGHVELGEGTTVAGGEILEQLLRDNGFSTSETDVVDGSGLADTNRVTCRLLVEVLDEALPTTPLAEGLAVAGVSGTLRERMTGTLAEGRVAAKTGRLNEVGALAGVATATDGTQFTFAWIGNTTDFYPIEQMERSQDRVAIELVEFPEGPSVDALSPLG